jgi:hypothetical protein
LGAGGNEIGVLLDYEDMGVIVSWVLSHEGLCLVLSKALGFLYVVFEIAVDTQWTLVKTTPRPSML